MDVSLDAVFNPAIYTKPTIFEQEGWHYELDLPEGAEGEGDGSAASLHEGTLRYNGVVFNEMKGALSDPMSVLDDAVNAALYPDTAYAHESGGDPRAIPTLTYEQFLDTHARHYNPSNSYITLYGDLDVDRALAFLDERYLSQPSAASCRMDAAVGAQSAGRAGTRDLRVQARRDGHHARERPGGPGPGARQCARPQAHDRGGYLVRGVAGLQRGPG